MKLAAHLPPPAWSPLSWRFLLMFCLLAVPGIFGFSGLQAQESVVHCQDARMAYPLSRWLVPLDTAQAQAFPLPDPAALPLVGGHLQGVQELVDSEGQVYLLATFSSREVAGLAAWRLVGDTALQWFGWQELARSPLRHAGGFQVQGNRLAVGIEDNKTRTYSELIVYQWAGQANRLVQELIRLPRRGAYERATAGAVALGLPETAPWVLVGSWDCKTLDVYPLGSSGLPCCPEQAPDSLRYRPSQLPTEHRGPLNQPSWASYQNLGLHTHRDQVYLAGMGRAGQQDALDVYVLKPASPHQATAMPPGLPGWWVPLWRFRLENPEGLRYYGGMGLHIRGETTTVWAVPNKPGRQAFAYRWRAQRRLY